MAQTQMCEKVVGCWWLSFCPAGTWLADVNTIQQLLQQYRVLFVDTNNNVNYKH